MTTSKPCLHIIITGRIEYNIGEGLPTVHPQVQVVLPHEKDLTIWGRMMRLVPGNWEFFDAPAPLGPFPQGVGCTIVSGQDLLKFTYTDSRGVKIESRGPMLPDFMATIENNDAAHVIERIVAALEGYRTESFNKSTARFL